MPTERPGAEQVRRHRLVDGGIAVLVQLLVAIPFVVPGAASDVTWQAFALTSVCAWALLWRRRWPFAVLLFVAVLGTAAVLYRRPGQPFPYASFIALYTVFALGSRRQRLVLTVLAAPTVLAVEVLKHHGSQEIAFYVMAFAAAAAFGTAARVRQEYTASVEERALRLEAERDLEAGRARAEAERAAAEERSRIAREMHDVLAHAVVLMTVQAEAGPLMIDHAPERAKAAFEAISDAGRDATVQLQRILSALGGGEGPGRSAPRSPQPTVADIPGLVAAVRRTGLAVGYEVLGERPPGAVPPDVQIAAFRTVQEALTNTVRHAQASSVAVRLVWTTEQLAVTVTDDGWHTADGGGPSGLGGPEAAGASGSGGGLPGVGGAGRGRGGHGLVGLRERAAACGGSALAGPRSDGRPGFEVALRLPLPVMEGSR
ncbi:sensor histidine kinase [Kitasatospora sp. NPDC050543]|uniref:sensor histidine kinase n=1 Tax=Kitasatospora sp. NPDC050543 TaxID=3364054 RepID=UPI00379D42FE